MRKPIAARIQIAGACMGMILVGARPAYPAKEGKVEEPEVISFQGLPFAMPAIPLPRIPREAFDIRRFGAVPGGIVKNTQAIARAIAEASAKGGGRVVVPAGRWLTGPIVLRSRIALQVDEGAELLFSQAIADYLPPVFTRWEGTECMGFSPLVYCRGCQDIAITGKGTLNGQGEPWWKLSKNKKAVAERLYEMGVQNVPVEKRVFATEADMLRPSFIQFIDSKNILIEGVHILSGPMWTIHPVYSENMVVRRVTVTTLGPNGDGCDPDSVRNMLIEDSTFSTRDDCIVIKSGLNEEGWRVGRPSENIVIRNVVFGKGNGGVVIGSEMSGGVRRVFAEKCQMNGTHRGLRIKSREGRGGVVEDVWYQDMQHRNLTHEAIQITTFYGSSTVEPRTRTMPTLRRIQIRDIQGTGAKQAIEIIGLPSHPIREVLLERVRQSGQIGAVIAEVENLRLDEVEVKNETGPTFQVAQGRRVDMRNITCGGPAPCVSITGSKTQGIRLQSLKGTEGEPSVHLGKDVPARAVRRR